MEQEKEIKPESKSDGFYVLGDGFAWNPLLGLPRNMPCPCDSGKKYKHCHLLTMPRAIPIKLAMEYKAGMKNPFAVKFTEDKHEEDQKPKL
jgi:hypothetical protein